MTGEGDHELGRGFWLIFSPLKPSNCVMFEPETALELHDTQPHGADVETDEEPLYQLDAESLFSAELANETLLNRNEEEALAKQIVCARKRVRAILRGARRLARAALADAGRGV